jgi:hypothetical protein
MLMRVCVRFSSSVKLAYSDAQEVIEGRPLPAHRLEGQEEDRDKVEKSINMLAVGAHRGSRVP